LYRNTSEKLYATQSSYYYRCKASADAGVR
jgi:hypothetical protein